MRKCACSFRVAVLFYFLLSGEALAKPPLSASARVDKKEITVGDELLYEINVTHSSGIGVDFPGEEINVSPFELKRYRPLPRREEGGQVTEGVAYFLTIFRLGAWEIPSVTIPYTDYGRRSLPSASFEGGRSLGGEGVPGSVTTEPVEIKVVSVLGEEIPQTLDIQRLKTPQENLFWSLFKKVGKLFLAIGMIALSIYGGVRLLPKSLPSVRKEFPAESSLRDLKVLKKRLTRQGLSAGHVEELSKILRRYLANQFDPLTLNLTTTELRHRMIHYPLCCEIAEKTYRLLSVSDLVKFANRSIFQEEFDVSLKEAEEIIRYVRPSPPKAVPS